VCFLSSQQHLVGAYIKEQSGVLSKRFTLRITVCRAQSPIAYSARSACMVAARQMVQVGHHVYTAACSMGIPCAHLCAPMRRTRR